MPKSSKLIDYTAIGLAALQKAYARQLELLADGTINGFVKTNSQGDRAMVGDIESESVVIDYLKEQKFPCRIIAEEHRTINLAPSPQYLVILDGIDGSSGMRANPKSRCGTIIAIAPNLNPRYNEFIFAGITEFATRRIVYAIKGKGAYLLQAETARRIMRQPHHGQLRIEVDNPQHWPDYASEMGANLGGIFDLTRRTFSDKLRGRFPIKGVASSGAMCIDLVLGEADIIGGVIAKGVFEPPAEYVLIHEIGGVLTDMRGNDIGNEYWLTYGRPLSPLIRAASSESAKTFLSLL
ncbi:hypothetical protein HY491_02775 [Candidatus Woesearchaeota archaeon]|nr:hypothetical protein [Candidatus Woesearchaeota archaeon]